MPGAKTAASAARKSARVRRPSRTAGIGERAEQLRLSDQQLRQQIAAGAEPHEPVEQLRIRRQQLDVPARGPAAPRKRSNW